MAVALHIAPYNPISSTSGPQPSASTTRMLATVTGLVPHSIAFPSPPILRVCRSGGPKLTHASLCA